MTIDTTIITFVDNPIAPVIVFDSIVEGTNGIRCANNGQLRITLEVWQADYGAARGINRVVSGRLFVSPEGAEIFANQILEFLALQREQAARTLPPESTAH